MKKFTTYLALLFCGLFMAAGLTSCLGDNEDSDYVIDTATQKKYQSSVSSSSPYTLKARFYRPSTDGATGIKYDSIQSISCRFSTDSTFRVDYFPVNKLDSAIVIDSTITTGTARALFDAIHNSTQMATISGYYWFPNTNYIQSTYYEFVCSALMTTTLHYNDADHVVAFYFTPNYSYGYWQLSTSKAAFQLYLTAIYPDYDSTKTTNTPLSSYFSPVNIVFQ